MQTALCNHCCLGLLSIIFSSARCRQKFAKPIKQAQITYFQKQEHEAILEEFTCMFVYLFPSIWQIPSQDRELKPKGGSFCIQSPLNNTLLKKDCYKSPIARAHTASDGMEDKRRCCCFWWHTRQNRTLCCLLGANLSSGSSILWRQLCRFSWC